MERFVTVLAALLLTLLLPLREGAAHGSYLWLSDDPPPSMARKPSMRHAHGGPVEMGKGGLYAKRLWLQRGFPQASAGPAPPGGEMTLVYPDGRAKKMEPPHGEHGLRFEMPREGFYNVYLTERRVEGDTLFVRVTKAEVLKHNCMEGHDNVSALMPPRAFDGVPAELIRERIEDEDFHTHVSSGDDVSFLALVNGRTVEGAAVKVVSRKGWEKTVGTDGDGRAGFQLIRDYYAKWRVFDKHRRDAFIAVMEYTADEEGVYGGKLYKKVHYSSTLTGHYYPSRREYMSYLYGLAFAVFSLTIAAGAVYVHRERRTRRYREDRFAEKD